MNATPSYPLRALSIGEIFDRAVTIYVRNFVVFTLMVLTLAAPYNLVQYFAIPDNGANFAQVIDAIQHPAKHPNAAAPPASFVVLVAAVILFLLLSPFVMNAVAFGVAAVYRGSAPEYLASFAAVFRRSGQILGTAIVEMMILLGTYSVLATVLVILFVIAALTVRTALPFAILLFVVGGILAIATMLFLMVLAVNYAFGTYAAVLERLGVGDAVASGFRRIFTKREFWKSMLIGVAYLALQIGVLVANATVGVLVLYWLKSYALQLAISALISSALTAFLTIVLAVYYYDVRTRAEGLDLEVELQRLTS